jgi:hypothetical protein
MGIINMPMRGTVPQGNLQIAPVPPVDSSVSQPRIIFGNLKG